jgi:hypothetical protein
VGPTCHKREGRTNREVVELKGRWRSGVATRSTSVPLSRLTRELHTDMAWWHRCMGPTWRGGACAGA